MANKNKSKGYYHERKIGEYRGDIKVELMGYELVGEIKYRDKSNFPSPFSVLDGRDLAIYKRRHGEPQTIVILRGDVFEKLMENQHDTSRTDTRIPKDG